MLANGACAIQRTGSTPLRWLFPPDTSDVVPPKDTPGACCLGGELYRYWLRPGETKRMRPQLDIHQWFCRE
jgi:hypothetical protein